MEYGNDVLETYRVSFIGHREVYDYRFLEQELEKVIRNLIENKEFVEFYVGKNGEFDTMVASAIKRARRKYREDNSVMILVLPYEIANMDLLEQFYDEIYIPISNEVYFKSAIAERNKWLVENTDLLVGYVTTEHGGAFKTLQYAKKTGLPYINLYEIKEKQQIGMK